MSPWIVVLICLILSAFFSGSEIAFVSANKLKIELDRKQGRVMGKLVGWYMERPDFFIATMLVGNNISLVVYGIQMAVILDPWIAQFVATEFWVLVIQTILATGLILLTAEFLPKALFRLRPNKMIANLAPLLGFFYVILYPITWVSIVLSNFLIKLASKSGTDNDSNNKVFSRFDLTHLLEQNTQQDAAEDLENDMRLFQNALDFNQVKLRECLVPRTEITAIEQSCTVEEVQQLFIETGFSRILVFDEDIDHIIGYVHHSDIFKQPQEISVIIRPIDIVPETMPASRLLSQLLAEKKNAAIVVDEFGGTAGLVTIEDILEEIFGEIEDEHDKLELEEVRVRDNEYRLSGRHEIDYLNEKYQLELPVSDEYETLAGLILSHHESIPRVGEVIQLESFEFSILEATSTRIESVRLTVHD